jgi:hypothetical protein
MMEAVRTSEMLVYFNETTRRYSLEGFHLHISRSENLKSHKKLIIRPWPVVSRGSVRQREVLTSDNVYPKQRNFEGFVSLIPWRG